MSAYSDHVEHPRYGRGPRFTDLRLREIPVGYRRATYISKDLIEGTAVEADLDRQSWSPVPVLYYFDLERVCTECDRPFIFFAEEQKYWYETLGFVMDSNRLQCCECSSRKGQSKSDRRRYEELFHRDDRSVTEDLEMAESSMSLIEEGLFHQRQTQRVRMLLNGVSDDRDPEIEERCDELRRRLLAFESRRDHDDKEGSAPE